jgi:Ca2+-binding RTX toxin-like protein
VKSRVVVIAIVVLAATAAVAVAATMNGDGTLIGTSGNDTINAGNGNDNVYALLGKDTINAGNGNGNDVLDGDGTCMQGNNNSQYCQDGPVSGDGGDTINAGNGNDVVFGGGGHNTINVGSGTDVIYGGPIGDTINVNGGRSSDIIRLGAGGGNTVNLFSGHVSGAVYAQNGKTDTINCNGSPATVYADKGIDVLSNCPNVKYTSHSRDTAKRAVVKRAGHKRTVKHRRASKHSSRTHRR